MGFCNINTDQSVANIDSHSVMFVAAEESEALCCVLVTTDPLSDA
jgi:hypothetical protein